MDVKLRLKAGRLAWAGRGEQGVWRPMVARDAWAECVGEEHRELVWLRVGESGLGGKVAARRGSRRLGVGGARLVRLLFRDGVLPWWEKVLVSRLKVSLMRTEGSMVRGDSSSGIVVEWIGRLYWLFKVNLGGELVLGETGGESS